MTISKLLNHTCLFAHFNPGNTIDEYVYAYLESLAALDFRIVFVSNSPITDQNKSELSKRCPGITCMARENKGADFGAWGFAFNNNMVSPDTDYLLLANDSVFGPLSSLEPVFGTMLDRPGIDFWGLTDSYQQEWHLQSYFICLSRKAFTSDAFKKMFLRDFSRLSKEELIQNGEIALTKDLVAAGLTAGTYIPYTELDPETDPLFTRNPTHYYFEELITRHKMPFLKKELIIQNPESLPGVNAFLLRLEKDTGYPAENIKETLINSPYPVATGANDLPRISVLCHLYYPSTIYYFLRKIAPLRSYNAVFIFNLSTALFNDGFFLDVLKRSFRGCIILHAPNKGRDIGGKLSAIDALLKLNTGSEYSLIIHDKLSPHTPTGKNWRDRLFRIIDAQNLPGVFRAFRKNKRTGIVVTADFIQNEYDPDNGGFRCTSNENLLKYIWDLKLNLSNYNFAAGTIFWIKTEILRVFFTKHPPLSIREGLEAGNVLDFNTGTNIHAWERLFSFIANAQGYKIKGI